MEVGSQRDHEAASGSPPSYKNNPLSCSTCRIRKIRCDKKMPCCHCVKANTRCTFPTQRKPRERKPHRKNRLPSEPAEAAGTGLAARLRSLEAQVSSLSSQLSKVNRDAAAVEPSRALVKHKGHSLWSTSTRPGRHVNYSFWLSINSELEQQLSIQRSMGVGTRFQSAGFMARSLPWENQQNDISMLLFKSFQGIPQPLHHPPEPQILLFWQAFQRNVECMVKISHVPTLSKLIHRALWQQHTLSVAENALLFSIYYVSAITMSEDLVEREFSVSKPILCGRMRFSIQQALVAAKFATTPDITILQALSLFILVLRKNGEARSAGSLVGILVHLAQCLRLHKDSVGVAAVTPFEREMRRRLFWSIIVVDRRSADDLGTDPMISEETWDTPLPLNINDDDFDETTTTMPESREGMTDMTFALIRVHTLLTPVRIRRLAAEEPTQSIEMLDQLSEDVWEETHSMIKAKYFDATPDHELLWAAKAMASLLISKMKLIDQCSFSSAETGNMTAETKHSRSTMQLASAIRVIEENHSANMDRRWANWKWIFVACSRWHGSAILFKEMLRRQWTPISEQAWVSLHKIMADSRLGELECLRDQPVMPLPFSFLYDLTRNYRESEFARLRSQPGEARRLCDEAVRSDDGDGCGGFLRQLQAPAPALATRGADRPGVSASSLERWPRLAGLEGSNHSRDISGPVVHGLLGSGRLDLNDGSVSGNATDVIPGSETGDAGFVIAETPAYGFECNKDWLLGEEMPVEYVENILDELF